MNLKFGRAICNNLAISESREWLVTNGIGGYAAGTISGVLTRRYHGLLIAALKPPVARTLLLTKLEETINYNGQNFELSANRWADGTIAPQGYLNIESFKLEGTSPVWKFAFADGILEKRIWLQQGENTTYIRYEYQRGSQPLNLALKALVNYRDHHSDTHLTSHKNQCQINELISQKIANHKYVASLKISNFANNEYWYLSAIANQQEHNFNWSINNLIYRNFALAVEQYRGLNPIEDHILAATGNITLQVGESVTIIASTQNSLQTNIQVSWQQKQNREKKLLDHWRIARLKTSSLHHQSTDYWIEQLVLAADQFIVNRSLPDQPQGKTIIAGYPWFTDWGRDTMIALPGLTISTGRYEIAKTILTTFAQYLDRGMLPNVFPDAEATPHYNTVDATLWYFEAIRAYYEATQDGELVTQLFSSLADIIDWHLRGTRHNIKMDEDGLLYAGEAGVQLTWMDAKVEDWVVTPRIGKPIEVNALWYNALVCMVDFAKILGKSAQKYQEIAQNTRSHFSKFWYATGGYCYDVIDSPDGDDSSFRPNQILAVSLPSKGLGTNLAPLLPSQQKMIVDKVGQKLLTSYGLRSLATDNSHYIGTYGGNQLKRDAAYHQGTTWSWLIGHFVQAHLQVYNNPQLARSFLLPIAEHLQDAGIGSISEVFDGDIPFTPRGCFAQAWSVAEVLRGLLMVN